MSDRRARVILAAGLAALLGAGGCASKPAGRGSAEKKVVLPPTKPEARALFDEGLSLMDRGPGSYEAAIEAFTKAIEIDGKLFEAWHNLGVVGARLGRWDAAAASLSRAHKLQPASRPTALALGTALERGGRHKEAAAVYRQVLARAPDDVELRLLHVQALRDGGNTQAALEEVQSLLAKDSKSSRAFNALGLVYYRMDKQALAESALRRAAELDDESAEIWNNLGLVALAQKRDREAFEAFDTAARLAPETTEALINKAAVYLDCGDYARARAELEKAARIKPDDAETQVALGVAYRGLGQHDLARLAYEKALTLRPGFPPALYNLGVLYMDFLSDADKARAQFRLYRKVAPSGTPQTKDVVARLKELR